MAIINEIKITRGSAEGCEVVIVKMTSRTMRSGLWAVGTRWKFR